MATGGGSFSATVRARDVVIIPSIAGVSGLVLRASDLGCDAPGVDIVKLDLVSDGNILEVSLRVRQGGAPPTCPGVRFSPDSTDLNLFLLGETLSIRALGGTSCGDGGWDCINVIRFATFDERVPGATGAFIGDAWVVRVPLVGTTSGGHPFDLRGALLTPLAYAEQGTLTVTVQAVDPEVLPAFTLLETRFVDDAVAPDITL